MCNRIRWYRSGTVNSNMVNSKFHLIWSYYEIFFYHFPNIPCLKCTVNSNFHLIRSKTLPTNDFKLTVPDLYHTTNKMILSDPNLTPIHVSVIHLCFLQTHKMRNNDTIFYVEFPFVVFLIISVADWREGGHAPSCKKVIKTMAAKGCCIDFMFLRPPPPTTDPLLYLHHMLLVNVQLDVRWYILMLHNF